MKMFKFSTTHDFDGLLDEILRGFRRFDSKEVNVMARLVGHVNKSAELQLAALKLHTAQDGSQGKRCRKCRKNPIVTVQIPPVPTLETGKRGFDLTNLCFKCFKAESLRYRNVLCGELEEMHRKAKNRKPASRGEK